MMAEVFKKLKRPSILIEGLLDCSMLALYIRFVYHC
jgi:hypothetical protein